LTQGQQQVIAQAIKPFATDYDMAFVPNDMETGLFVRKIQETLDMGGWLQIPWSGPQKYYDNGRPIIGVAPVVGVIVVPRSDLPENDRLRQDNDTSAKALVSALSSCGIQAQVIAGPLQNLGSPTVMHILVGKKLM